MRNIIWLSIDSLSDIHVTPETMPTLCDLLELRFCNHVACTPYTSASWYNQITGKYAQDIGYDRFSLAGCNDIFFHKGYHLQSNVIQLFKEAGYQTVLDSFYADWMDWLPGFAQSNKIKSSVFPQRPKCSPFLWVFHYVGLHHDTTDKNRVNLKRELYPAVLKKHDKIIGRWVDAVYQSGDILVITSDHGVTWVPGLDEHHGATLYESSIRTLFGIKGIDWQWNVTALSRNIDVAPTLLALALEQKMDCEGVDLIKIYNNEAIELDYAILETGSAWETPDFHSRFGVRWVYHKYVFDWTSEQVLALTKPILHPEYIAQDGTPNRSNSYLRAGREILGSYLASHGLERQYDKLQDVIAK